MSEFAGRPKQAMRWRWSDETFRGALLQVLVVAGLLASAVWLWRNASHNLEARQISTGFGFLSRQAGMPIADSIASYSPADSFLWALFVGVLNTLRVAVIGIVLATAFGTAIGIGRLSKNWLIAKSTAAYVEFFRDLPLLLQVLLWYLFIQKLPATRQAIELLPSVFVSNRGIIVPSLDWAPAHAIVGLACAAGILVAGLWNGRLKRRRLQDGQTRSAWPGMMLLGVGIPVLAAFVAGVPWTLSYPQLKGFNFTGGATLSPEYLALLAALTTYTAAFIAEIVRAGIASVPTGQREAAESLGFSQLRTIRLIVLPQALRMIIPPLTNQYLNLTKNSSLAVAIGYQDVVSVANTMMNQTGQAIEAIALIMVVFLTINLTISLTMNWFNARAAHGTR